MMNLRRGLLSTSVIALTLLGAALVPARSISATDGPTIQPSYAGDCTYLPAGATCLTYADGYVWLAQDTITGWGSNHGTVEIFYGHAADYGHALGTMMVWKLPK